MATPLTATNRRTHQESVGHTHSSMRPISATTSYVPVIARDSMTSPEESCLPLCVQNAIFSICHSIQKAFTWLVSLFYSARNPQLLKEPLTHLEKNLDYWRANETSPFANVLSAMRETDPDAHFYFDLILECMIEGNEKETITFTQGFGHTPLSTKQEHEKGVKETFLRHFETFVDNARDAFKEVGNYIDFSRGDLGKVTIRAVIPAPGKKDPIGYSLWDFAAFSLTSSQDGIRGGRDSSKELKTDNPVVKAIVYSQ